MGLRLYLLVGFELGIGLGRCGVGFLTGVGIGSLINVLNCRGVIVAGARVVEAQLYIKLYVHK